MTRVPLWSLAFLLAAAPRLGAQSAAPDERWQVTLDDGRYVWDIRLVKLDGDSLVVRQSDSLVGVPVAHITEVRLIRKSEVQMGGGGNMAGAMSALMGGDDEVYDLSPLEFAERMRTIQKILLNHPAAP
jgi:hypothetical protein